MTNECGSYSKSQSAPKTVGEVVPQEQDDSLSPNFGLIVSDESDELCHACFNVDDGEWPMNGFLSVPRYDEENDYRDLAAVGVTFLFLMALRKEIRNLDLFKDISEPNLLALLDLVALGTICDIVNIKNYNRVIVKKGLDLIVQRRNKNISIIIDNSKINFTPTASDLGYIVGPQINAASRLDDSSLASKLLITNNHV